MTPYILAEIASAHLGNVIDCMALVQKAQEAGADGVKIQIWEESEIFRHPFFENLRRFELSHQEWKEVSEVAAILGIDLWVEIIGRNSMAFAASLSPHAWKVPHNLWLRHGDFFLGKKVFARVTNKGASAKRLAIGEQMYPTTLIQARQEIQLVKHYAKQGQEVLYADHTHSYKNAGFTCMLAHHAGADFIEKHICLDRSALKEQSKDFISALEPEEFKHFVHFMGQYDRNGKVRALI